MSRLLAQKGLLKSYSAKDYKIKKLPANWREAFFMMNYLATALIVISTTACFSQLKNYEKLAIKKYDTKSVTYTPNTSNTYVLCIVEQKGTAQYPQNYLKYFVYDIKGDSILYDATLSNGSVEWYNESEIAIYKRPGIMAVGQTMDDYITLYNVKSKASKLKSAR